jgi:hypothetical protein
MNVNRTTKLNAILTGIFNRVDINKDFADRLPRPDLVKGNYVRVVIERNPLSVKPYSEREFCKRFWVNSKRGIYREIWTDSADGPIYIPVGKVKRLPGKSS